MKAITLHQPWATLMAIGAKRIETRSWSTQHRGPLAIHAAKALPAYAKRACYDLPPSMWQALGWPVVGAWTDVEAGIRQLPVGAIVATVVLVGCVRTIDVFCHPPRVFFGEGTVPGEFERELGNYEPGRFAWVTTNLKSIDPPIPASGAQGLWEWKGQAA